MQKEIFIKGARENNLKISTSPSPGTSWWC